MNDPDNPDKRSNWLKDPVTRDLIQYHRIKKTLYSGNTKYQHVEIVDTRSFGICLVLDGKIQSGELDEFIYHESLVHPAMLSNRNPESVFVAGGGEGATLREIFRHNSVKKAVMVDIDREVVELCRRYLPSFHRGSFNDPRAEIHFTDARKYIENTKEKFDVIIIDIVDPLEAGPACLLYTQEYYRELKGRMNRGGIMVIQSGSCGWTNIQVFTHIVNTLKTVFSIVEPYQVYVPSFVELWGFTCASDTLNPSKVSKKIINGYINDRLNSKLRFYDGVSHQSMFMLPKTLRKKLAATRKIITDANPVFI
jgi:spermidine synthase